MPGSTCEPPKGLESRNILGGKDSTRILPPELGHSPRASRRGISKAIVQNHHKSILILTAFFPFPTLPRARHGNILNSSLDFSAWRNQRSPTDAVEPLQLIPEPAVPYFISCISLAGDEEGSIKSCLFIPHPIPEDEPRAPGSLETRLTERKENQRRLPRL